MTTTTINLDPRQLADAFIAAQMAAGALPLQATLPTFSDRPEDEITFFISQCETVQRANGWNDDQLVEVEGPQEYYKDLGIMTTESQTIAAQS